MTITIDLPPNLEAQIQEEAARRGVDAGSYILGAVQERLEREQNGAGRKPHSEANLLQQINVGLPPEVWIEYRELIKRRRAGTMTAEEQARAIAISDQLEATSVRRLRALTELAALRGTTVDALMDALGIRAPSDA